MTPDFDDLGGGEVAGDERERLRRVHDLLLAASPPPPLSARLARAPRIRAPIPHPRIVVALSVAAAAAIVIGLSVGYTIGRGTAFTTAYARSMHGVGRATQASALIDVGRADASGNRPLEVTVHALPPLPAGGWYDLYLTRRGRPVLLCGTFETGSSGSARISMNIPGKLAGYGGWIVTTRQRGRTPRVLLST